MPTFLATWMEPGRVTLDAMQRQWLQSLSLLDALEAGLVAAELDPSLLAIGLGSLPNADGELELDAAIMDGSTLDCGAVCAVRGIVPVISVARRVLEETPHIMLAGDQARRFAIAKGFRPRNLLTAECIEQYSKWMSSDLPEDTKYRHSVLDLHDTVTVLGAHDGKCAAASSTSGWAYKLPGRVGDSPIVGAGIYADDEVGCAGATGLGEELWKAAASFRTVEFMRQGLTAQEACEKTVEHMLRRQPRTAEKVCVVIAISKGGDYGAALTFGKFDLWISKGGEQYSEQYIGRAGG